MKKALQTIQQLKHWTLDIVFPPLCLVCRKHPKSQKEKELFFCNTCRDEVAVATSFFCSKCRKRLIRLKLCTVCKKEKDDEEEIFVLAAASSYKNKVVQEIIHTLKYKKVKGAIRPICFIIEKYLNTIRNLPALGAGGEIKNFTIVPIPLNRSKERKRGFNQALLIAETLLKYLDTNLPIESGALVRVRETKSQTEIKGYKSRKKNIAECFKIKNPEKVKGKNIILVDDVFTSGATMREAVRTLKKAGAKKVLGFVVAKT